MLVFLYDRPAQIGRYSRLQSLNEIPAHLYCNYVEDLSWDIRSEKRRKTKRKNEERRAVASNVRTAIAASFRAQKAARGADKIAENSVAYL